MAKKKTAAKSKAKGGTKAAGKGKGTSKGKSRGSFLAFMKSERCAHIRGTVYVLFAAFLLISLAAYYATGCDPTRHWLKAMGYGTARFFATNLFGIGSLGFSLLFFVYGMRLWGVKVMPWWKTFGSTLFWMVWLSTTLGYIAVKWIDGGVGFEQFAGIGLLLAEPLEGLMGWWTLVLLVAIAIGMLVMVHKMELPEVHLPKVDLKKAVEELEKVGVDESGEEKEERRERSQQEVIDLNAKQEEEDEGVDFDEAAMALFTKHTEEKPVEVASGKAPEPEFSIDDAFAQLTQKAGVPSETEGESEETIGEKKEDDCVTFTIEGLDDEAQDVAEESDTTEDMESEEELDEDDYRRHYGIDEPYDPHLDLGDYVMPDTGMLEDWEVANVKVTKEELVANKDPE